VKPKNDLTAEHVRSILYYNPDTGEIRWKWRDDVRKNENTRIAGKVAGSVNSKGSLQIRINGHRYLAHRLAWVITHGAWPPNDIDHIDGDRANNRIDNLRLATRQENLRNVGLRANTTTGVTGVCWDKSRMKFEAYIRTDGKQIHLGRFPTIEEATAARHAAEITHFGDFRRAA
jgi:hypothetical protein